VGAVVRWQASCAPVCALPARGCAVLSYGRRCHRPIPWPRRPCCASGPVAAEPSRRAAVGTLRRGIADLAHRCSVSTSSLVADALTGQSGAMLMAQLSDTHLLADPIGTVWERKPTETL